MRIGSIVIHTPIAVDRPPELANGSTAPYVPSAGPVAIGPGVGLSDPDGDQITGAQLVTGSGFVAGDTPDFSAQNGITGFYNPADGRLTLTGDASSDDYQAALQSIQFLSTAGDPTLGGADPSRAVDISVTEQSASGASIGSKSLQTEISNGATGVDTCAAPQWYV